MRGAGKAGKVECIVRVYWNPQLLTERLVAEHDDVKRLKRGADSQTRGTAYFMLQKIERNVKHLLEEKAQEVFQVVFDLLSEYCEDFIPEKPIRTGNEWEELLKFSCLLRKEAQALLLEKCRVIDSRPGFSLRVSDLSAPYSFV